MSTLFEQFLAGEDGISALLRALPAYAPPAGMDAWFVEAARAAAANAATTAGAAAEAPQAQAGSAPVIRAAGAQTFNFEPPASLHAAFAAAATQADQAQASQRQAVQTQLAQGGDAVQAIGAPLSAQAHAWIDAQQHVELAERPTAFVRSVSSRADAPSDSEVYTGTAAPAALSDLAEAASARRFEINNNNSKTDSDSDSDNHRLGKHVHAHAAQASSAPVPQPASEPDTREVAAAATTQAQQPAMADTHVPATPALRSTRRRRWMPTLAFAASITLAVGVGLQWQAHQPVPDAAMDVAPAPIGCTSRNDRFWPTATSDGKADRCPRSVFDGRAGAHRCACISHCICTTRSALARRSARSHNQIAARPCASVGACRCTTGTGTRALRRCSRSGAVVAGTDGRRQCCSRSRTHRSTTTACTDRREPGRCICRCIACTDNTDAPCCDAVAHIGRGRRTILGDGPQQIHILHIARRHGVRPGCNRGR